MSKEFPILKTGKTLPWEFLAPHEERAITNHKQTLKELAARGGLDYLEIELILKDKPLSYMWGMAEGG